MFRYHRKQAYRLRGLLNTEARGDFRSGQVVTVPTLVGGEHHSSSSGERHLAARDRRRPALHRHRYWQRRTRTRRRECHARPVAVCLVRDRAKGRNLIFRFCDSESRRFAPLKTVTKYIAYDIVAPNISWRIRSSSKSTIAVAYDRNKICWLSCNCYAMRSSVIYKISVADSEACSFLSWGSYFSYAVITIGNIYVTILIYCYATWIIKLCIGSLSVYITGYSISGNRCHVTVLINFSDCVIFSICDKNITKLIYRNSTGYKKHSISTISVQEASKPIACNGRNISVYINFANSMIAGIVITSISHIYITSMI